MSSYLGELTALKWACKATKVFRGNIRTIIRTDNKGLVEKWEKGKWGDNDVRVFRRWAWFLANEGDSMVEYVPGSENKGADLMSRPDIKVGVIFQINGDGDQG